MDRDGSVFFSIITINYNNAKGLEKTLSSVAAQTFDGWEQVVIDGGSDDESIDVIKQFLKDEAYARHIGFWCSEKDEGIYNAMNKGARKASGEWCIFLNSGDAFHDKNVLADCHMEIAKTNAAVVYGDMYKIKDAKKKLWHSPVSVDLDFLYFSPINHQSTFIRRELQLEHPYDETLKIASDWKFFLELCIQCGGRIFTHIPRAVSDFDMSGTSYRLRDLSKAERKKVISELLAPGVAAYLEAGHREPMRTWTRFGKQWAQVPRLWNVCIFFNKAILKILGAFKIVMRVD